MIQCTRAGFELVCAFAFVFALLLVPTAAIGEETPEETPGETQEEPVSIRVVADPDVYELTDREPEGWLEPPVIRPRPDERVSLVVNTHEGRRQARPRIPIPGNKTIPVNLRSYTSPQAHGDARGLVGPTIRVPQRYDLRIDLINGLAKDQGPCDPKGPHNLPDCFDHTNLHTHGLHISPSGIADNVLISVAPKGEPKDRCPTNPSCTDKPGHGCCFEGGFRHHYPIGQGFDDGKHYPGTFWYHAHRHGSTAVQLASGMAGALIVEDPPDSPIAGYRERVMMMQQLAFDDDGEIFPEGGDIADLLEYWGGRNNTPFKRYTTLNGVVKPAVPICPGEVQRLRIIDSGIIEMDQLELAWLNDKGQRAFPVPDREGNRDVAQLIAYDGLTVKQAKSVFSTETDRVEMGPGYRIDLLAKDWPDLRARGFQLVLRKQGQVMSDVQFGEPDQPGHFQQLAVFVEAAPEQCQGRYKTRLLDPSQPLPTPFSKDLNKPTSDTKRRVDFRVIRHNEKPLPVKPDEFLINGRLFEPVVDPEFCLPLKKIEEWELSTYPGSQIHPFHIHVNAFQVIRDGKPAEWRDTILVKQRKKEEFEPTVVFRTHYENFTGQFVFHCHILTHEDRGMMQMVEIVDSDPPRCENTHTAHSSH